MGSTINLPRQVATKTAQIPGVAPVAFTPDDLDDPQLQKVNETMRQLIVTVNALVGAHGKIPYTQDIDMQGNSIFNVKNIPGT